MLNNCGVNCTRYYEQKQTVFLNKLCFCDFTRQNGVTIYIVVNILKQWYYLARQHVGVV